MSGRSIAIVNTNFDPSMRLPLVGSFVFHLAVMLIATFGLPSSKPEIMDMEQVFSVELVDIGEYTATTDTTATKLAEKPRPPKADAPPEPAKPKQAPKVEAEAPPTPTAPQKPDLREAVAEEAPEPPPSIPLEKPKPPPKAKAKAKPKPEKPEPVKEAKAKPKKSFDSVLKNLVGEETRDQSDATAKDLNAGAEDSDAGETGSQVISDRLSDRLSISEEDQLRQQLTRCWNPLAGAQYAENLVVELELKMNPDRTIRSARIMDQSRYNRDSFYRAAAEAAIRAVRHPACTPLKLPPDKYAQWQDITIRFDPKDLL